MASALANAATSAATEWLQSSAQALEAWAEPRRADLAVLAGLAQEALRTGELPPLQGDGDVPLRTAGEAAAVAVAALALLLSGRARAVARDVVDTLAAVALLVVMLVVLLGVPLGALYVLWRGGVVGVGSAVAVLRGAVAAVASHSGQE
jgi:hypothetical protein